MKSNINLNAVTGTYASCINAHIQDIYSMYADSAITAAKFISNILEITQSAADTSAKRKFVANLTSKKNKDQVVMYVANVCLRAEHLSSNPDDKWSNER